MTSETVKEVFSSQMSPEEFKGSPTILVLSGLPLSGKTTLGKKLSEKMDWHFIDVDYCRRVGTGDTERHIDINPWASGERRARKESEDMRIAYSIMHEAVRANIALGRSVICAATYSRTSSRKNLLEIATSHPKAKLKAVYCLFNDTNEEVLRRIKSPDRDKEVAVKL
jgi:predicted kinase